MDLWGLCPDCERWFYCDHLESEWTCPVCSQEPVSIENRATWAREDRTPASEA